MFRSTNVAGGSTSANSGSTGGSGDNNVTLDSLGGIPVTLIGAANGLPQLDANRKIAKQYIDPGLSTIAVDTRTPISAHRLIMADDDGYAVYVNNDNILHANRCLGLSTTSTLAGGTVTVQRAGELTDPSFNFMPGPLWVGNNGYITSIPPDEAAALFSQQVGIAITPTRIDIRINSAFLLK